LSERTGKERLIIDVCRCITVKQVSRQEDDLRKKKGRNEDARFEMRGKKEEPDGQRRTD